MDDIWAQQAMTADGWRESVRISIADDGTIASVATHAEARTTDQTVGILLPAPANLHSHAFQRAMAGLAEQRGPESRETFWTWRQLMFRFLEQLTPEDVEAIAAFAQMEMLEAGYAAVAEFHYLHHQPDGTPYGSIAELSERVVAAADTSGIGLTLLPVLYEHGGCDGRPLAPGQIRFGNLPDRFATLHAEAVRALKCLPGDARIGVAAHSLRAVSQEGLISAIKLAGIAPIHLHIAEQIAEVAEVEAAWGQRPVDWLYSHHNIHPNWCLIHATQMQPHETVKLARSGAVVGLCPITESSLGDGIFDAVRFVREDGTFGVGSDSNIQIQLTGELRTLEYSQRLRDRGRAMLAKPTASTGRVLFETALKGGAQAAGRASGAIKPGNLADLVTLDSDAIDLVEKSGDDILDSWIFAVNERIVRDVWSAGRHVVTSGQHRQHDAITDRYRIAVTSLRNRL